MVRTCVVNLHKEKYDVYIGRAGKGQNGYFGNPFPSNRELTREDSIDTFKVYLLERVKVDPEFKARLEGLRGLRLGCFCKPKACHGDVIVAYLEGSLE